MQRRNLLALAAAVLPASFVTRAAAATDAKVVYHLSDLDKVAFVLGNIGNHYSGMGGPTGVTIALVVHGPALKAFEAASATPGVAAQTGELVQSGLKPYACINTMRAFDVTVKDLLPGFGVADKGGVVLLAELQGQGYAYLRP
jgi:intracellular sulfur oxidation DsrE/DsrF family protein